MPPYARFPYRFQESEIYDVESFWEWFQEHNQWFLQMLKRDGNVHGEFNGIFKSRLEMLNKELSFAVGFLSNGNIDVVLIVEGKIKNIVFAEEIVAAAPAMPGWQFTALMQQMPENDELEVYNGEVRFNRSNVFFFSTPHKDLPDFIDITIVYKEQQGSNPERTMQSCYEFVLQLAGELEMLTMVDQFSIKVLEPADNDLIPISKLSSFLRWRESEFVEKYKDVHDEERREATEDKKVQMEAAPVEGGLPFKINITNRDLLCRENTAPYPWLMSVRVEFDGSALNGYPDKETEEKIKTFELELSVAVEMYAKGQLELLSTTCNGGHSIVFASNEFRQISKVAEQTIACYNEGMKITYSIIKDKYWKSINIFKQACLQNGGTFMA